MEKLPTYEVKLVCLLWYYVVTPRVGDFLTKDITYEVGPYILKSIVITNGYFNAYCVYFYS